MVGVKLGDGVEDKGTTGGPSGSLEGRQTVAEVGTDNVDVERGVVRGRAEAGGARFDVTGTGTNEDVWQVCDRKAL